MTATKALRRMAAKKVGAERPDRGDDNERSTRKAGKPGLIDTAQQDKADGKPGLIDKSRQTANPGAPAGFVQGSTNPPAGELEEGDNERSNPRQTTGTAVKVATPPPTRSSGKQESGPATDAKALEKRGVYDQEELPPDPWAKAKASALKKVKR